MVIYNRIFSFASNQENSIHDIPFFNRTLFENQKTGKYPSPASFPGFRENAGDNTLHQNKQPI